MAKGLPWYKGTQTNVIFRKDMKFKLTKEQIELFDNIGTIVNTSEGSTYRYLPFWFKETDEVGVYEMLTFEQLPNELIETIKKMRD